jgi:hypothetical protein
MEQEKATWLQEKATLRHEKDGLLKQTETLKKEKDDLMVQIKQQQRRAEHKQRTLFEHHVKEREMKYEAEIATLRATVADYEQKEPTGSRQATRRSKQN